MDVIIRPNDNPVNGMITLMSGLINNLNKVVNTVCLVNKCIGLSQWIFMSEIRQVIKSCLCSQGQAAVQ